MAAKLSGHSARRHHTTVGAQRQLTDVEAAALANWVGASRLNPTSSMPVRYNGARGLTELGVKLENILATKDVLSRCEPGAQLTWARYASELRNAQQDVRDVAARLLTTTENPLGDEEPLEIFALAADIADRNREVDTDTSDESSSEDDAPPASPEHATLDVTPSPTKRSRVEPMGPRRDPTAVETFYAVVGEEGAVMHAVRGTVHVRGRDTLRTACGEDIEKWAGVVSVSAEELSGGFYSLCGRKRCFRDVSGCCEGLRASRARSGHGDALPILTYDAT